MLQQPLLLLLCCASLGDVLDCKEDHSALAAVVANGECVELDSALADMREGLLELEAFDRHMLGNHAREQLTQARYVPFAARQLKQRSSMRFRGILPEYLVEAATAGEQMKRVVEDQERLGERIDDRKRKGCLLYTSPSPRDQRGSRMPSSA